MRRDKKLKRLLWPISVLFLLGFLLGCASKEEKEARHYSSAIQYIEKNELRKAVIELKNVVQLNPKNDAAYYQLGEVYLKLNQGKEAVASFKTAASINPDNIEAQLKTGQIFLLENRTDEARKKATMVLEKSPKNTKAMVLLSGVQVREKDIDGALETMQEAVQLEPDNAGIHMSLGGLFLLKKELAPAETEYAKAKALEPTSPDSYIGLSRIFSAQGKWKEAEAELLEMIDKSGSDSRKLHVLGRFYETQQEWAKAERTYTQAVDNAPEEDIAPLLQLAQFYRKRKNFDKALEAMQKASKKKKDDLNLQVGIARIYLETNQIKSANEILDNVLAEDKGHVEASYLKGRIYLAEKEYDKAIPLFDFVIHDNSKNTMGYYFRALCHMGKGNVRNAKEDLLRVVELSPQHRDARLLLADIFLREHSNDQARQHIDAVLQLEPKNASALMLQGILKTAENDLEGSETAFREVLAQNPNYGPAYYRLGVVYSLMDRNEDALANLEKAYDLDPKSLDALTLAVGIYVKDKNFDAASRLCLQAKGKLKDSPAHLAALEYLEGNISLQRGKTDEAQEHFKNAIAKDPNMLGAYVASARTYIQEKNVPGAISKYESLLEKDPNSLAGHMGLGIIYDQQGEGEKAETHYRKAMEINPDFAPAANNLAWNLLERGKNIDEALGFAQIAKGHMPDNASVMDTLGWIYYQKGSFLNAIYQLQDSLSKNPDNPVINYHLGMAYYKNNQSKEAKTFLEKALALDQNFKGAREAETALKEMEDKPE